MNLAIKGASPQKAFSIGHWFFVLDFTIACIKALVSGYFFIIGAPADAA
tara:strand:+ start:545 stop:691 length:147 start_codon:yes stop_codon:yes gene_type:complete